MRRDNFYIPFMEKIRRDNFWHHNIKKLFFKNGAYKCKQHTQKLPDNSIKHINLNFFFAKITSFPLTVKLVQFNNEVRNSRATKSS